MDAFKTELQALKDAIPKTFDTELSRLKDLIAYSKDLATVADNVPAPPRQPQTFVFRDNQWLQVPSLDKKPATGRIEHTIVLPDGSKNKWIESPVPRGVARDSEDSSRHFSMD
jgi:hypothetical protein